MAPKGAFSALVTASLFLALTPSHVTAQTYRDIRFGGTYANLKPVQRTLVDDWIRRFNALAKPILKPAEIYDDLPLSVRTTFEAVTHAMLTSPLTDENGDLLGKSIDVIEYIETVHGMLPESGSDLQYRIYVTLKPNALQILDESREFRRNWDNKIYHRGYPINYRQRGTPAIQISCSRDGKRADIDVDYRSSKFPKVVLNGHFLSTNSDVRAGNNYKRHVKRWSGFSDWWKSILGLPVKETDLEDEQNALKVNELP